MVLLAGLGDRLGPDRRPRPVQVAAGLRPPVPAGGVRLPGDQARSALSGTTSTRDGGAAARAAGRGVRAQVDVLQQPDREHAGEHRAAAVRHERQGYAGDRHDARGTSRCSGTPGSRTSRRCRPRRAGRRRRRCGPRWRAPARSRRRAARSAAPAPSRPSSSPATVNTKSVCCSGTKPGAGLRAVEEPLAEEAAVADRDPGLLDVVAGAARVEVGVGEGEEAVELVLLEEAARDGGDRGGHAAARPAAPASGAVRRRSATTPSTVADSTSMVPRSGWSRISTAGTPAIASIPTTSPRLPPPRGDAAAAAYVGALGDPQRHPDHHGELGELRRLDRHPAELQPRPRAVDGAAHRQHQHQPGDRAEVDERRDDPHPPVVGGQHQRPSAPGRSRR